MKKTPENIKKIFSIDLAKFVCQKYNEISENDKKTFWIIFATLNLMFIFHTINFLWGCDDWYFIKNKVDIFSNFWDGRFGLHLLKVLFFQGNSLPVINNVFAFLGFSLGAIALLK